MIRPARPGEAPALTDLSRRSKAHWGYDAAFMELYRDQLTIEPAHIGEARVFVADREGTATGLYVLRSWKGAAETIELDALFVAPEAIGSGIGRALWDHLVETARDWGGARLYIVSDPNAVGFYERMGAVATGAFSTPPPPERRLPILIYALSRGSQ